MLYDLLLITFNAKLSKRIIATLAASSPSAALALIQRRQPYFDFEWARTDEGRPMLIGPAVPGASVRASISALVHEEGITHFRE